MKERTATRRNFFGAFWGGLLGILAVGYLHPAVLPFGCFLGVVVGWWYQEIWQSMTKSVRHGVAETQRAWNRFTIFVLTPTRKLKEVRFDVGPYVKFFHFLLSALVWVLRRPIAFIQWVRAHPVNRARMATSLSVVTYWGINALWVVPMMIYCGKGMEAAGKESLMPLLYFLGGILLVPMITFIMPIIFVVDEETPKMRKFYRTWEQWAAGPLRFFGKNLALLFGMQIAMLSFFCGAIIWFAIAGGAFLVLIVAPISAAVGLVKGVYEVSTKAGHWLCFGATLVVTGITAWMTYPYLNDTRVLWAVALFAGLASAGATEMLRRFLVWFFANSERAQNIVLATLGAQLAPSGRFFWKVTETLGDRMQNLLPRPV